MAERLSLPRMSDTMEEGVIANILIKEGDVIKAGTVIAEVETDKATMDLESFQEGTVLHVAAKKGDSIPVNGLIAILGKKGEDFQALLSDAAPAKTEAAPVAEEKATPKAEAPKVEAAVVTNADNRVKISPLAKKMAEENNVSVNGLAGSGDEGRITKKDIEEVLKNGVSPSNVPLATSLVQNLPIGVEVFEEVAVSQMRKVIAKRLAESMYTAPHFYLTVEVNMDEAKKAREQMNAISPVKISFNDMVIKACAMALKKHPKVNSQWSDEAITINHHVHVGVAVAVEDGLVVPVVRFTDQMSLSQIGAAVKDLAGKARNKKLQPSEMEGSTFTVSNLGMFGITEFTSIINQPNSAILSVGAIIQKPVVRDGQIVVGHTMNVTLACDHRTVDGATGAEFLQTLRTFLENPVTMLA